MENILKTIITKKKEFIKEAKKQVTLNQLRFLAEDQDKTPLFLKSMQQPGINIIAEIKRASPSKGLIRPDLDPAELSKEYEQGGAAAISVLTERAFFQGSCADLCAVRQAVTLPVLRKDFIISAYQIYEAVVHGADAVLLIVRILEKSQLHDYLALCRELNLDALVEAHTEAEIEIAMAQGVTLIGVTWIRLKPTSPRLCAWYNCLSLGIPPWQKAASTRMMILSSYLPLESIIF